LIARLLVWIPALVLASSALARQDNGDDSASKTRRIKAIMVRNLVFSDYTVWPSKAFENARSPLVIGVLGADPFGEDLDNAALAEVPAKSERKIKVVRETDPAKLASCHLVFISSSEKDRLKEILKAFEGRPVVTVGDTDGFAEKGTLINLGLKKTPLKVQDPVTGETKDVIKTKVTLEINLDAVDRLKAAGVTVTSRLLELNFDKKVRDEK
jgi:hypothetical protein